MYWVQGSNLCILCRHAPRNRGLGCAVEVAVVLPHYATLCTVMCNGFLCSSCVSLFVKELALLLQQQQQYTHTRTHIYMYIHRHTDISLILHFPLCSLSKNSMWSLYLEFLYLDQLVLILNSCWWVVGLWVKRLWTTNLDVTFRCNYFGCAIF